MKQWFLRRDEHDPLAARHRTWSGKHGVWVLLGSLALMFGLVSLLVLTTPLSRNELGLLGGLRVIADRDTTVFVGDRKVGIGTVDVVWNELLGAIGRPPLAISGGRELSLGELPAMLGDAEAEVVWQAEGATGTFRGNQHANFAFREVVLRRASGGFDPLFVIECEFPSVEGRWKRLLIPVRTRKLGAGAADYFPQAGNQSGGNVSRGMIPSRRDRATFELKLSVNEGPVPGDLAGQLNDAEWWIPASE